MVIAETQVKLAFHPIFFLGKSQRGCRNYAEASIPQIQAASQERDTPVAQASELVLCLYCSKFTFVREIKHF